MVVVCPNINAGMIVRGSRYGCCSCGAQIAISPACWRLLRSPGVRAVCLGCLSKLDVAAESTATVYMNKDEVIREVHDLVPNMWVFRN